MRSLVEVSLGACLLENVVAQERTIGALVGYRELRDLGTDKSGAKIR